LPHDASTVGQLVAQSATMMSGYWHNAEATRNAMVGSWYKSGDLGSIDPDGYVSIAARRNDLILSGGANVYPAELERVIAGYAGVKEVAVAGGPHPKWGQTPVAFVVWSGAVPPDPSAIIDYCRANLAHYKAPSRVIFIDALPRNTSDKVA